MPSFLNKVFGYKKQDDKDASRSPNEASDNALLDGKYEAISPVLSPTTIAFADGQGSRDIEREVGFSLFKPKSRVRVQKATQKGQRAVPQLSLHLPGPKENYDSRTLGVVFEADPHLLIVLDDVVIGAKRLNPLEALILLRVCSQAVAERGLETLGIMHPHWFSSSPDIQRKLISLFIHSLTPKTRITTLSPTLASPTSAFENEISYTRSPHDVAAVLRWGLRHLKLENGHFGRDSTEWAWYKTFFDAERGASYPPKAFTELLLPQLPTAHIELLTTTLDVIASLASHAETNSISGSKLSKFLGLWLLTATRSEQSDDWTKFYARWERAGRILEHLFLSRLREESFRQHLPTRLQELVKYYPYNKGSPTTEDDLLPRPRFSTRRYDALFIRVESLLLSKFLGLWLLTATRSEQSDDWTKFYARWERAGRILEHLFLSRLREESFRQHLPTRLQELVKYYPYSKGSPTTEDDLLPRPRFSTRRYDALFIRVESLLVETAEQPKQHPIRLILEAFQLPSDALSGNEYLELWNALKTAASEASPGASPSNPEGPQLSRIFVDETAQLLSSIPADSSDPASPILFASPITKVVSRRRSSSLTRLLERKVGKSNGSSGSAAASPISLSSPIITDWAQFSMSGFGDAPASRPLAAIFDQEDVEVTQPPVSRKSSGKSGTSRTQRRRSVDNVPSTTPTTSQLSVSEPSIIETKLASVHVVEIDEAFIDFWSDAILDPISANWPTFVICGLKPIPGVTKPIHWLVIEQAYRRQQPLSRTASPDRHGGRSPRPSFRSDISGFRISSLFTSTRKRFSVFSKSTTELALKQTSRSPKIGELGEILAEEDLERMPASTSALAPPVTNGNSRAKEAVEATATAVIIASEAKFDAESQSEAKEIPTQAASPPAPDSDDQAATSTDPIPTINREPESVIFDDTTVFVPGDRPGTEADFTNQQVQDLSEVPSVEPASQPGNESSDGSFPVASAPVIVEVVPAEAIVAEPQAQSGPDVLSSAVEVAEDAEVLPPAPEAVVLATETPGSQFVALDTSEPVAIAQATEPEVVAVTEESSPATLDVIAQVEPDVVPSDVPSDPTGEPVSEVSLAEIPIVDAEPELPVTPQVLLVQEPVIAPEPQVVDEEPPAPSNDVAEETVTIVAEDDPPAPVAEDVQALAPVTAEVEEEPAQAETSAVEPESVQDEAPEPVVEEDQAPASVFADTVEVPVQEQQSEPADVEAPEPAVEDAQAPVSVIVDVAEEPAQVEESAAEELVVVSEAGPELVNEEDQASVSATADVEEPVQAEESAGEPEPVKDEAPETVDEVHAHVPVTADVVEEPVQAEEPVVVSEPVEDVGPEIVDEDQAPISVIADVVEESVHAEQPVVVSEAVEDEGPEPIDEEEQTHVPVTADVVEEPVQTATEPEPVEDNGPEPVDEEDQIPVSVTADVVEEPVQAVELVVVSEPVTPDVVEEPAQTATEPEPVEDNGPEPVDEDHISVSVTADVVEEPVQAEELAVEPEPVEDEEPAAVDEDQAPVSVTAHVVEEPVQTEESAVVSEPVEDKGPELVEEEDLHVTADVVEEPAQAEEFELADATAPEPIGEEPAASMIVDIVEEPVLVEPIPQPEPFEDNGPELVDEENLPTSVAEDVVEEPVVEEDLVPIPVTADVVEEPIQAEVSEPADATASEPVEEDQVPISVTADVVEEPIQVEESEFADAKAPEPVAEDPASVAADTVEEPVLAEQSVVEPIKDQGLELVDEEDQPASVTADVVEEPIQAEEPTAASEPLEDKESELDQVPISVTADVVEEPIQVEESEFADAKAPEPVAEDPASVAADTVEEPVLAEQSVVEPIKDQGLELVDEEDQPASVTADVVEEPIQAEEPTAASEPLEDKESELVDEEAYVPAPVPADVTEEFVPELAQDLVTEPECAPGQVLTEEAPAPTPEESPAEEPITSEVAESEPHSADVYTSPELAEVADEPAVEAVSEPVEQLDVLPEGSDENVALSQPEATPEPETGDAVGVVEPLLQEEVLVEDVAGIEDSLAGGSTEPVDQSSQEVIDIPVEHEQPAPVPAEADPSAHEPSEPSEDVEPEEA
ncbi:hypothetical protein PAXINDRAFT_9438 [Paxillus involutus ATCC 200175]|nr:hypothetical protein PAXINDRAFT_9438 [Paxillus involutus ATCC 200175]